MLSLSLRATMFSDKEVTWLLNLHTNLTVGRTVNRSTVGAMNNRIADSKNMCEWQGGFRNCDTGAITIMLNRTPMKPIGYSNGFDQMKALVAEGMK